MKSGAVRCFGCGVRRRVGGSPGSWAVGRSSEALQASGVFRRGVTLGSRWRGNPGLWKSSPTGNVPVGGVGRPGGRFLADEDAAAGHGGSGSRGEGGGPRRRIVRIDTQRRLGRSLALPEVACSSAGRCIDPLHVFCRAGAQRRQVGKPVPRGGPGGPGSRSLVRMGGSARPLGRSPAAGDAAAARTEPRPPRRGLAFRSALHRPRPRVLSSGGAAETGR
jgi:hypothetical protein